MVKDPMPALPPAGVIGLSLLWPLACWTAGARTAARSLVTYRRKRRARRERMSPEAGGLKSKGGIATALRPATKGSAMRNSRPLRSKRQRRGPPSAQAARKRDRELYTEARHARLASDDRRNRRPCAPSAGGSA